jgi:alpha-D-ribose 1-methylphosphonate 5-triphosphate diphosphatase PhnM
MYITGAAARRAGLQLAAIGVMFFEVKTCSTDRARSLAALLDATFRHVAMLAKTEFPSAVQLVAMEPFTQAGLRRRGQMRPVLRHDRSRRSNRRFLRGRW